MGGAYASVLAEVQPLAVAGALSLARMLGLLILLPLSTRLGLTGLLRAALAVALALPTLPGLARALAPDLPTGGRLLLLGAKETALGVAIGLLFASPFWAAEAAGEYLDQQRGSQGALLPDPANQGQSGASGTLFVLALITLFLLSGGMRLLVEGVWGSFQVWPVQDLAPHLAPGSTAIILGVLDHVMRAGLVLSSPLLAALLLTELSLALVGRIAPQLNLFDLAMAVKGVVFVVGLPLYAVLLLGYLHDGLAPLADFMNTLRLLRGD